MMTEPKAPKDVVLPFAPTDDGKGVRVLRAREDRVEAGEMRPVADGQPLHGELVRLTPREDSPALCDVEVLHDPKAKAGEASTQREREPAQLPGGGTRRTRPAQVATDTYREHYTQIFGDRSTQSPSSKPN